VQLAVIAAVFPVIFIGELPDKTMFASLVMATRGKPLSVWVGAAAAFTVHVAIAVTVGVALFKILPRSVVDFVVAGLFAISAVAAFISAREGDEREEEILVEHAASKVAGTAFVVVFLAEWGDLTQVLTANAAVRYDSAISVAVGATLALWSVAALAVIGGHGLLGRLPTRPLRLGMGVLLSVLAVLTFIAALR
jgi:putative Ca2+/H+ antiporter (TMEM165/GDT1 family)